MRAWNRDSLLARSTVLLTIAFSGAVAGGADGQVLYNAWVTDDTVRAVATLGDVAYIGGRFTRLGPRTGGFVAFSLADGTQVATVPQIGGFAYAVVSDGSGGLFVGGDFLGIGGLPIKHLAHILPDGTLDQAWDAQSDYIVRALARSGSTLYVGGEFTAIGGQLRNGIGAVDVTTGLATPWNPDIGPMDLGIMVRTLAVAGSTVFAGGAIRHVGGKAVNGFVALDAASGKPMPWSPTVDTNGFVRAQALIGSTLYLGGEFVQVNGSPRNGIAAIDATSGVLLPFDPNPADAPGQHDYVFTLAASGSTLYVGGYFHTFCGQNRSHVAAIDLATNTLTAWNPGADNSVYALAPTTTAVYAAGLFKQFGGQPRLRLAAADLSGAATAWDPTANDEADTFLVTPSLLYTGGRFASIGGIARNSLAAIDLTTGLPTAWSPVLDCSLCTADVYDLATSGSTVYVAGSFTAAGGQPRQHVAALDATSGAATAWAPQIAGAPYGYAPVTTLAASGSTIYLAGSFGTVNGQPRARLAAVDAAGVLTGFNPSADDNVSSVAVASGMVYAGGYFTNIGGQPRNRIAALDASTGAATAWNPDVDSRVRAVAVGSGVVYAGGDFYNVGGQKRSYLAAIDATTGLLTAWNPVPGFAVDRIVFSGGIVYVSGPFTVMGNYPRHNVAAIDGVTGHTTAWNAEINPTKNVMDLAACGSRVCVAGDFYSALRYSQRSFAAIGPSGPSAGPRITHYQFTDPSVVPIELQRTGVGMPTPSLPFGVSDDDTPAELLMVTGRSSYKQLVPDANIVFGGSGAIRTVIVTPAPGLRGVTDVTITVTDGAATASTTFTLIVEGDLPANTPPTISAIADRTTTTGLATSPIPFIVNDAETSAANLSLSATSSDTTLVPVANIVFGGSGANRTVTLAPAAGQAGTSVITITVSDGVATAQRSFTLTVTVIVPPTVNTAPTISDVSDQVIPPDTVLGPLSFTIGDAETPPGSLVLTVTTSDASIVPASGLVLGGMGANRTLTVTPAAGRSGYSTITIAVSDGDLSASDTFVVMVKTISLSGPFYLSEGATGGFFDLYIALANPNPVQAPLKLTFLPEGGAPVTGYLTLEPYQRDYVPVDWIDGLENAALSTMVESLDHLPVLVERTMFWDQDSYYAGHGEKAGSGGDTTWMFAEGCQGFFDTYLLLANPNDTQTTATIRFLTEVDGVITRSYSVPPKSRLTVYAGWFPELQGKSFGITVTFSQPAVAERAMYFGTFPFWNGGHASAGVNAPATRWFHAEGATGDFFETYILVANPNDAPAHVTFTYFLGSGQVITHTRTIDANSRTTVNVEWEDVRLADVGVSTQVTSDLPVVSERSMYWTGPASTWYEAHNSFGSTMLNTKWGLAEGMVGGDLEFETYILVNNPNPTDLVVTVTYLRYSGDPIVKTYTVKATSRYNIHVNGFVPELQDEIFAAVVDAPLPIAVERALYWNALGAFWAGGTNAGAIPLR